MQRTREVTCTHASDQVASPSSTTCEACGSDFNLRLCTTCGHVGCCESQQAHNTEHAQASGHPVIRSMSITEQSFSWCYECRANI